ncbi:MAG: Glu-tRNA(Gln) amidotransferase subunit GatD [Candidatus Aenigmatarchaeota archaeon]
MYENYSDEIQNFLKSNHIEIGQRISIKKDEECYEGLLMPKSSGNPHCLVIKLDNGYNIGIDFKNVEIKKMKEIREITKPHAKLRIRHDSGKPTIVILHTGGTVASRVDYRTGAVSPAFSSEDIIAMFPELQDIANIRSRLVRNMWSQDMRFSHYNILAKEVAKELEEGCDGIIITHGTDMMAVTSAALAFILEDVPVPVILVGSQRSSDRGSSDAAMNLICAARFIANSDFSEVALCMHENMSDENCLILPATKTRKMHTSRRDAFRPINAQPFARVSYSGVIEFMNDSYKKKDIKRRLALKLIKENIKVGVIKNRNNMFADEFLFYSNYDGLIIEASGLGCSPISRIDDLTEESGKTLSAIKTLLENNVVVFLAPQTIYGRINMNVYEDQRIMKSLGVLGDQSDMLSETAYVKLAWALSNYPKEKTADIMMQNLRGELSERNDSNTFLY